MANHWEQIPWELPVIQGAIPLSLGVAGLKAYHLEQHILQASKRDPSLLDEYAVNMMHILFKKEDDGEKLKAIISSLNMRYENEDIICKKISQKLHATLGGETLGLDWHRSATLRLRAAAQTITNKNSAFTGQDVPDCTTLANLQNTVAKPPNPMQWIKDIYYEVKNKKKKKSDNACGLNLLKLNIDFHNLAKQNRLTYIPGFIRGTPAIIRPELLPRIQYLVPSL